ncbi:MAG: membrane protein YdbS with pleckstrin-like domain [Candidatus Azotimanducaceae bacterium]|jgi:membrane protein YdbS with pleckstrin-like domain
MNEEVNGLVDITEASSETSSELSSELSTELSTEVWSAPAPRYVTSLRLVVMLMHGALLVALMLALNIGNIPFAFKLGLLLGAILLTSFLWFELVWASKRAKHLRYRVRSLDINLVKGYLFRHDVSVSFNRIQHIEVSQNPVERLFKLGTLRVFTAGTIGSDLHLPGLPNRVAHQLKAEILNEINLEVPADDDSVSA